MKTYFIPPPSGGIVNDPRADGKVARMVTGFDVLTNPKKLTPYRDSESGDSSASTNKIQNYCVALRTGTTYSIYGLGVVSGTSRPQINYKDISTGGSNDLGDAGWTATANNAASGGSCLFKLFTFYKKTGLIYLDNGSSAIATYDPSGVASFNSATHSLSFTNIAEGLVHSKDDILYVPYDNKIAKNDNGSWTDVAITFPTGYYITSIAEQGNNIAVMCAPLNGLGGTRTFIWDRDSTLTTLQESIDWGEGVGKITFELDGTLIGISQYGGSGQASTRFKERIVFKEYDGYEAKEIMTLEGTGVGTTILTQARQRIDNRLYFQMSISLNGVVREGVWSIGKSANGWSLFHERTPNNDTALVSGALNGFFKVGDYIFQSYQTNSAFAMSKTNDQASYTSTAIWETKINPSISEADGTQLIKLYSIGANYDALPTNGQIVVKHRIQGGTYKTVFTETTTGATYTEPVGQYADGTHFSDQTKEHEFRVESTLGAVPVGLIVKAEFIPSNA